MTIDRIGLNKGRADGSAPHTAQIVVHSGIVYFTATPDKPYNPELTIREQTREVLSRIDRRLARAGSDKSRILTIDVTLCDPDDVLGMNEVWNGWVDPDHPPARICTIAQFTKPHIRVEMTIRAAIRHNGETLRRGSP